MGNLDDIMDHGAGARGDHPDVSRQKRDRLFAGIVKKAFGGKPGFQLLKRDLKLSDAAGFEILKDDLVIAPGLIDADAAQADDVHAVFGHEFQISVLPAEHDAADLGFFVLQGKIEMLRGRHMEIRDLAADPEKRIMFLQKGLDLDGQFRNRIDFPVQLSLHGYPIRGASECMDIQMTVGLQQSPKSLAHLSAGFNLFGGSPPPGDFLPYVR